MHTHETEKVLLGGGRNTVTTKDGVVYRSASAWSPTTIAFLKHLEEYGYPYSPRVVDTGFDRSGRETLVYVEGVIHPEPWLDSAIHQVGKMLRGLHDASASFVIPQHAVWRDWYGRSLGGSRPVIGHCDAGPWNIVAVADMPVAFIDWEEAGPVDALFELAQACWLNAQLHDDDIAEKMKLGSAAHRARQVRYLLDGYGLALAERRGFIEQVLKCSLLDASSEAIEANVTVDTDDPQLLWSIAWRTRSAAWILRNKILLQNALA